MKKIFYVITLIIAIFIFNSTDVSAFSSSNYKNRKLCGTYEVASFKENGTVQKVSCHNTFDEAKESMKKDGSNDLAILNSVNGTVKILDANVGLLDLTMLGSDNTFNIYTTSELEESAFTYMVGSNGGVDGALLDSGYSNKYGAFTAKIKISNVEGWININAYEIVPITWVKSSSSYTINNEIRHNYVLKIQEPYSGSSGRTIGPKPSMLNEGTYYSYDGHYFYKDIITMIKDYKAGNYNNSVNKDKPYYNYYQYLSNHTRTNYSSINLDEYIRNNLGYVNDVFGSDNMNKEEHKSSRLYGKGAFFYYAQEKYGANALLSLSLSRNESGNGTSNISINKNNGFGLNAVDSNPYEESTWYPTFMNSIYEFAQYYITNKYLNPNDYRYYGAQYGNKGVGMNVKYASDVYWSEKMASNYYYVDKAFGMQDYNYYQLGIITQPTYAKSSPSTSSKNVYYYRKKESSVVILDEIEGQEVNGNKKWYKVVSDMNIDSNFNEIKSGIYNWDSYVYVPASYVSKINEGKNGYISPNEVIEYQDKNYSYDLFVKDAKFTPEVAKSTKETKYYYDPTLQSTTGKTLLKDKYIMVYAAAYDENEKIVAYLVTSDYWYDQKHWVSSDSIDFITCRYGQASVTVPDVNSYTWVNSNTQDIESTKISGLYNYAYTPILDEKEVDGQVWYKVPVSLTSSSNEYGWTLASAKNVLIKTYQYTAKNNPPTITAQDKTIVQGTKINELEGVTAYDKEDGNLTEKVSVVSSTVNIDVVGKYTITYKVTDTKNKSTTKTINVTVTENKKPVISAKDLTITKNTKFEPLKYVSATDEEDGKITNIEVIENTVKIGELGTYKVTYKVVDSYKQEVTKTIKVTVVENQLPTINATDKTIYQGDNFNPLENVTATDPEDGKITEIEVIENTVITSKVGQYKVIYKVTDKNKQSVTKEIKVTVIEKKLNKKDGEFYLHELNWNNTSKTYTISGYLIILNAHNNDNNAKYYLKLKNQNNDNEYSIEVNSWTKNVPYSLGTENGYDYNLSWFKGEIDLSKIPAGDYNLYMKTVKNDNYAETQVTNIFNRTIDRRAEDSVNGYNFKVQLSLKNKKIELNIREGNLITTATANTFRNMVNNYDNIEFVDGKLKVVGTSYNYDGTYNDPSKITRKLVLEDIKTYKRYVYDIGSTKDGSYAVKSTDNKSKDYAWYNNTIDIKDLPKGTYAMIVYTKTVDSEDYGEISDIFKNINKAETTINGKKYKISLNENRYNRIELIVE